MLTVKVLQRIHGHSILVSSLDEFVPKFSVKYMGKGVESGKHHVIFPPCGQQSCKNIADTALTTGFGQGSDAAYSGGFYKVTIEPGVEVVDDHGRGGRGSVAPDGGGAGVGFVFIIERIKRRYKGGGLNFAKLQKVFGSFKKTYLRSVVHD